MEPNNVATRVSLVRRMSSGELALVNTFQAASVKFLELFIY